eukprot:CAMPEP_0197889554 /NCGR_PEP_ID=MMETSP1439-20131203/24403_1 /TAXON_ID=66791 /ORGANISM="Gonyaulax spinifera, Strain CCMP409" /LENGTH=204 /DNA_ID=CAMNT_0043509537 /DNA_START=19 /DNA_END=635 /DNA_ORIENTATION=-
MANAASPRKDELPVSFCRWNGEKNIHHGSNGTIAAKFTSRFFWVKRCMTFRTERPMVAIEVGIRVLAVVSLPPPVVVSEGADAQWVRAVGRAFAGALLSTATQPPFDEPRRAVGVMEAALAGGPPAAAVGRGGDALQSVEADVVWLVRELVVSQPAQRQLVQVAGGRPAPCGGGGGGGGPRKCMSKATQAPVTRIQCAVCFNCT